MFRTLFFLRLECGQECVVALLALRGRKTYHAIMLEEKRREKDSKRERENRAKQGFKEKKDIKREESGTGQK